MAASNSQNPNHQPNQFTTDEYVLAYHGPLLYEARVSSAETNLAICTTISKCSGGHLLRCTDWMLTYTSAHPYFHLFSDFYAQILLAENWNESNTLLGTTGPHYFIHYKGWKQT